MTLTIDTDPTATATTALEQIEGAWNSADGSAFGAAFAEDAEFVDIRGTHHRGRMAIGGGHQAIFDSIYAGSVVRYELALAKAIAPGCVLAVATATLVCPSGPLEGTNHSRLTIVLSEDGGDWSIAGFHNTLVQG